MRHWSAISLRVSRRSLLPIRALDRIARSRIAPPVLRNRADTVRPAGLPNRKIVDWLNRSIEKLAHAMQFFARKTAEKDDFRQSRFMLPTARTACALACRVAGFVFSFAANGKSSPCG